jgi:hypothetical protein
VLFADVVLIGVARSEQDTTPRAATTTYEAKVILFHPTFPVWSSAGNSVGFLMYKYTAVRPGNSSAKRFRARDYEGQPSN